MQCNYRNREKFKNVATMNVIDGFPKNLIYVGLDILTCKFQKPMLIFVGRDKINKN